MSDPRAIYKEGFAHFVEGEVDQACEKYREALAADEQLAIAWNGLSIALQRRGDLPGAIEAAERLVELEPDDPLSHTNLSRLLQQQGKVPEAEAEMAIANQLQMRASQ